MVDVAGSIEFDRDEIGREVDLEEAALPIIKFLHKVGYEVLTHIEDDEVMVIEYCHDPRRRNFGANRFTVVSEEEYEELFDNRREH